MIKEKWLSGLIIISGIIFNCTAQKNTFHNPVIKAVNCNYLLAQPLLLLTVKCLRYLSKKESAVLVPGLSAVKVQEITDDSNTLKSGSKLKNIIFSGKDKSYSILLQGTLKSIRF